MSNTQGTNSGTVKGILKTARSKLEESRNKKDKKRPHFDENNLRETYHPANKTYGHMIIEEPDTPFPRENVAVDAKTLQLRLQELGKKESIQDNSLPENISDNQIVNNDEWAPMPIETDSPIGSEQKVDFQEKRKKHYNKEWQPLANVDKSSSPSETDYPIEEVKKTNDFLEKRKQHYSQEKKSPNVETKIESSASASAKGINVTYEDAANEQTKSGLPSKRKQSDLPETKAKTVSSMQYDSDDAQATRKKAFTDKRRTVRSAEFYTAKKLGKQYNVEENPSVFNKKNVSKKIHRSQQNRPLYYYY